MNATLPDSANSIAERLATIRDRITAAAQQHGRDPHSVRLVAVSKRHPSAAIRTAYAAGQRDFGENYVQEMLAKADELSDLTELRWHMIGHVQRNKAARVIATADVIHTLDSIKLGGAFDRHAETSARRVSALIEVNVSGEDSKSGCLPDQAREIMSSLSTSDSITVAGLMAIPAAGDAHAGFERLAKLRDELRSEGAELPELSIGMSGDFETAIGYGATYVRIGTAIFGPRPAS